VVNIEGKLRIVYVCGVDLSNQDAATVHTLAMCAALVKLRHDVVVVAPGFGRTNLDSPARIVWVPTTRIRFVKTVLFAALLPLWIVGTAIAFRADAVYEREICTAFTSAFTRVSLGIPHVVEVNGNPDELARGNRVSEVRRWMIRIVQSVNFRFYSGVVAVTDGLGALFRKKFRLAVPIHVAPNGVDSALFKPGDPMDARRSLGLPPGGRYVTFVGSFYPHHRFGAIVEAAGLLARKGLMPTFLAVGTGPDLKRVMRMAADSALESSFVFTGSVEHSMVPRYICAADVCVFMHDAGLRNFRGVCAIKVLEYLSCGRPVVVTDDVVVEDVGRGGVVIDGRTEGAAQRLANGIERLLVDEGLRRMCGVEARGLVLGRYEWSSVAQGIAGFLHSLRRGRA
jgi:glycosyltransferase involved in cell wall biosynthesis